LHISDRMLESASPEVVFQWSGHRRAVMRPDL
jgi:hypothetical protein